MRLQPKRAVASICSMTPISPGWYEYVDPTRGLTRLIYVFWLGDELRARFPPNELDEAIDVAAATLPGEFRLLGN